MNLQMFICLFDLREDLSFNDYFGYVESSPRVCKKLNPDYTIEQVVSSLLYETFCFIFLSGLHGTTRYIYLCKYLYFLQSYKHAGTA